MNGMEFLISYALSFVGQPYRWGGDDPINGFDCSGLVQEILAAIGMDPEQDQTAQGLYNHFSKPGNHTAEMWPAGALCFFGDSDKRITHVGFSIGSGLMVEAGGGGSKIISRDTAATANAYVRVRPIQRRGDLVAVLTPNYP